MRVSMSCIVCALSGGVVRDAPHCRTLWHVIEALPHDAQALAHLLDAYCRAVVAVAMSCRLECRIRIVRSLNRAVACDNPIQIHRPAGPARSCPNRWLLRRCRRRCPWCVALKMRFLITSVSYSSSRDGMISRKSRNRRSQPCGRSWATPPMRNQLGCIRNRRSPR